MKKLVLSMLGVICVLSASGCAGSVDADAVEKSASTFGIGEGLKENLSEEVSEGLISLNMLSQDLLDTLREEWDDWEAKDEFQKLVSSHIPGLCYKGFETLEECEEFLGFDIFSPLEDSDWLEKGTYVGMPLGYANASRFYVNFYGTMDGKVEWIRMESGYRAGEIKITVAAQVEIGTSKEVEDSSPLITEDSGEQYEASTAVLVRGAKTYSIRVIGRPGTRSEVQKTLEKVLAYFE